MNRQVNTQIEEMVGAWTRFQGQMWDSLFGIAKGGGGHPWEDIYRRPLEVGEDIVNCILQQQSDFIRIAMKNSKPGNGAPRIAAEWAEQVEKAAQHWVDAQRQAWKTWFAALRQVDPYRISGGGAGAKGKAESQADNLFAAWQEATQSTLQAQADWMSNMASIGAKAGEELASSVKSAANNGAQAAQQVAESTKKTAPSANRSESRKAS